MIKGITLLFLILMSVNSYGKISISGVSFDTEKNNGSLKVHYNGDLVEYPELKVSDNKVFVYIPDSHVLDKINKKIAFGSKNLDTVIRLDSWKKTSARISVELPFNVQKQEHKVSVLINDNSVEITIPKLTVESTYMTPLAVKKIASKIEKSAAKDVKKTATVIDKEILNESFLKNLEADEKRKTLGANDQKTGKKKFNFTDMRRSKTSKKSGFSLMEYGTKFAAFLAVVLLLFYGLVTLFKKGFIKKGKLGFLHKTDQVQVLSQTYIAPKKSLMLIKAHNQVFLVSNSDAGISLVSEITDTAGLLKESVKEAVGSNFDDNFFSAEEDETVQDRVKLKEDIAKSNSRASLSDYLNVRDKVKFSDQIKKKVKKLKPLQ